MMEATSPFEVLKSLDLLSWTAMLFGWERGWVTKSNVTEFAVQQLQSDVEDSNLSLVSSLASADQGNDTQVADLLTQLSGKETGRDTTLLREKWRLARLIELQAMQLDWDEKVTRLEELAAQFGYPPDMRLCSRYVARDQEPNSDPLEAMENVISELKKLLGVC